MQWIISDIHGMYFTLSKLLDKVYSIDESPSFVFVGDYIDRGGRSKQVVDLVIKLKKEGAICLRGNHDDVFDLFLNDHMKSSIEELVYSTSETNILSWSIVNGMGPTLSSYGIDLSDLVYPEQSVFGFIRSYVSDEHKSFFNELELYWENDTHFSCHAFMYYDRELPRTMKFMKNDAMTNTEVLWNRFPSDPSGGILNTIVPPWDKIGVFGHTPVMKYGMFVPVYHHNIRLIDTGVFMNNYMTAYNCQGDYHVLQASDSQDFEMSNL